MSTQNLKEKVLHSLADETLVDLETTFQNAHIQEVIDQLDSELVGLKSVKTRVKEIATLLLVDRARQAIGLTSVAPSLHMCFAGNPGTGAIAVAARMAEILHRLGYLRKGHLVAVKRDDLVGQDIGETTSKTKEVLKRAMGGVLFIDEAYFLYRPEQEQDYGLEAIETLLQVMEREDLGVILAGYKAPEMEQFFNNKLGISSRIAHRIDFPDYTIDELLAIARIILEAQHYRFSSDAETAFRDYLAQTSMPDFANARSVRNALEQARMRQANRLLARSGKSVTKKDLMTIKAEDILASRVFKESIPDCVVA